VIQSPSTMIPRGPAKKKRKKGGSSILSLIRKKKGKVHQTLYPGFFVIGEKKRKGGIREGEKKKETSSRPYPNIKRKRSEKGKKRNYHLPTRTRKDQSSTQKGKKKKKDHLSDSNRKKKEKKKKKSPPCIS